MTVSVLGCFFGILVYYYVNRLIKSYFYGSFSNSCLHCDPKEWRKKILPSKKWLAEVEQNVCFGNEHCLSLSLLCMHTYSCWADHCKSGLLRRVKAKSETRKNSVSRNSSADAHLLYSLQQHRKQNKTKWNKTKQFLGACIWFACNDLSLLQSKSFLSADLHVWLAFHN